LIRTDSSYSLANAGSKYWSPTATLVNALPLSAAAATVPLENGIDLFRVEDGPGYALLGTEWVEITGFDASSYEVDIKRGLFDTVPAAHVAGERIWFMSTYLNKLSTVYSAGKHPDIKMLTRTGKGILDEGNATLRSMSPAMNSRFIRPYPPGRFEINDVSYPPIFIGQPALTWAHRNRETQLGTLVSADEEGSWALEAGAYYTLKIYKENGALMQTITPIVTEGYTLSELDERNWSGLGSADDLNSQLRFVLTVHRADHSSGTPTYDGWQNIDWTSDRFGIVPLPDNDFTGSGEGVIALWNMESAALTTDSIGSNTLSNNGVTADTSRKMQGGSSAYMTTGDWMDITDASLNTGFPFRSADGSGAVEEFTICAWVALDSLPGGGYHTIIAKYDWDNTKRSWMCDIHSDYWGFLFGYNSGASDLVVNCSSITKPVVGRWYHVAWTFENSTGGWKCRVYDTWTDSVEEETGTIAQTVSITDSIVEIGKAGSTNYMDGSIDELVVFNRVLSSADIDKIRQGTYGS
jgi:hypothetical protein